jgi:hypothetical protein
MTVKLVTQGTTKSQVFNVVHARTVIGRQEGCALRIPSGEVSRRHCVLVCADGNVMVEDLDSCNGTFLNGKRIKSKRLVHPGDTLQIGPVTFTVDYSLEDTDIQPGAPAKAGKGSTVDVHEAAAATRHASAAADTHTDPKHPALQEEPDDVAEAVIEEEDIVEAAVEKEDDVEEDDVVEAKLAEEDSAKPWELPKDEELRDILTHLEE